VIYLILLLYKNLFKISNITIGYKFHRQRFSLGHLCIESILLFTSKQVWIYHYKICVCAKL